MNRNLRSLDVIDVNCRWSVWIGSRAGVAYRKGTVLAHDAFTARRIARETWPETRIGFVEMED